MPERFHHFTIDHAGKRWSGDWKLKGREVCVSSAYGSQTRAFGRRNPERVAVDVLKELVEAWRHGHRLHS